MAGYKPLLVGSPKTVADGLIGWMEESGIDGFNIEHIVCPGDFAAFVELVVPELQRRGVYKTQLRGRHIAREAIRQGLFLSARGSPWREPPVPLNSSQAHLNRMDGEFGSCHAD